MTIDLKLADRLRFGGTRHESHLVDGFVDGRVSRREFLRHGSVLGLSLPILMRLAGGTGLGALGTLSTIGAARAAPGGTIRIAQKIPAAAIDPVATSSSGGLLLLQQVGEFLCRDGVDLILKPMLAESWKPNEDSTVWTFTLRKGVKFHDGREMKADDVVASIDRLCDPANSSNALSAFAGFLKPGGTKKVDDYTVAFDLDAANGSFPYLVSSDNYNAIILPADYAGDFEKNFNGTGPFKIEKYTQGVGATFVRNDDYWGEKALPDRLAFSFYADTQPMLLALQGGEVDVIQQVPVLEGAALLNNPDVTIISLKSSAHQELHMRCDMEPFKDKRVRRAIGLALDRERLVKGLMRGRASLGNDSPFAPVFPTTNTGLAQRAQDLNEAKALLEAAGMANGKVTLTTENFLEIPQYAQLVQAAAREIGFTIDLNVLDQSAYYGDAVFGKSNWLDSTMGITDYGHRGVPNVYLSAPLTSDGTWNAAHFKNPAYDKLVAGYIATADVESQKQQAGQIGEMLLDETPVIFGYFYDYLVATAKNVTGVEPTALSQIFLANAKIG